MRDQPYVVGHTLGMPRILRLCDELAELPSTDTCQIDFSATEHFEPFGMLMLASAIRRLRARCDAQNQTLTLLGIDLDIQSHQYAHYLGFWSSIGFDTPGEPIMADATMRTVPISKLSYKELFRQAGGRDPVRAGLVTQACGSLAQTLTEGIGLPQLQENLAFAFREIIRNAFEHGRTDLVWFTGATRPTKNDVQVAILDEGQGVRASLAQNAAHNYSSDRDALLAALRPGVTKSAGRVRSRAATEKLREEFPGERPEIYDNSGYGLTLTSVMGQRAGGFSLVSGSIAHSLTLDREFTTSTSHSGTAVRLFLRPSQVDAQLFDSALRDAEQAEGLRHSVLSASKLAKLGIKLDE